MSTVLGKRKSRSLEEGSEDAIAKAQSIFQKHFESRFKPLKPDPMPKQAAPPSDEDDDETETDLSESEWGGLSGEEDGEGTFTFPFYCDFHGANVSPR